MDLLICRGHTRATLISQSPVGYEFMTKEYIGELKVVTGTECIGFINMDYLDAFVKTVRDDFLLDVEIK